MKPPLTKEQKERFHQEFTKIISEAPKEVQDKWDGNIYWSPIDEPLFDNKITARLPPKSADKYLTLLNKVKGRTI